MTPASLSGVWGPRLVTALLWLLCAAALVHVGRHFIGAMNFRDPDDALRLVEVRDWMAGQSWFDVTQYRSHPPAGAPMHWSRLVDLPVAAAIALAGLVAEHGMAERLALVAVPLLTLLLLFALVHALTVRATGRRWLGPVAAAMLATSIGVLVQFQPLRIDHHGWQIVLDTGAVLALLGMRRGGARGAALAGLAMAASLTIAIEGLPLAVAIGGVLALFYAAGREGGRPFLAYLGALTGGSGLLLAIMLGWPRAGVLWCDAMSPAYVVPLAATTLAALVAFRLLPQGQPWQRLAAIGIAGVAGGLVYASFSHQCLAGPFAQLDPIVARLWYRSVAEGMPVWSQPRDLQILIPLPSVLGLLGAALALRHDASERRAGWAMLLALQLATFAVSMVVMRAMGIAHVLALPATAWLFASALRAAMRLPVMPLRVILGFGCFALTPIGAEAVANVALDTPPANGSGNGNGQNADRFVCSTYAGLRGLDALPPATLFAPLDIGAHLLVYTHHSVVATGHHRNREGMRTVITAFVAEPDAARTIIAATPARYLVYCGGENEVHKYARLYPRSLTAALLGGRPPGWLQPMTMRPGESVRVYRIVR